VILDFLQEVSDMNNLISVSSVPVISFDTLSFYLKSVRFSFTKTIWRTSSAKTNLLVPHSVTNQAPTPSYRLTV
jgi:hypothetical protein